MNISQMIAKLRRERGMTQEALAEEIGVSPQTISKWENATTLPDVMLLPLLADVFDVTIDVLYGREEAQCQLQSNEAIDRVVKDTRRAIVSCGRSPLGKTFSEELAEYEQAMKQDDKYRSMVQSNRDFLYFREKRGVLALLCPENGWHTLFEDDKAAALLTLLADADFRKAMSVILTRRMMNFTLTSLMRAADIADGEHLEHCLTQSGIFERKEVMLDDATLVFWQFSSGTPELLVMYAVMAYAQEAAGYVSYHYFYRGDRDCAFA